MSGLTIRETASRLGANRRRGLVLRGIVTTAWAALIFYLSTQGFGSSYTAGLLKEALGSVHWQISPYAFEILHAVIRKSAHLTEYCIFALLLYGSLEREPQMPWSFRRAVLTLLVVGAYSLTDEFHQRFVPGGGLPSSIVELTWPEEHRECFFLYLQKHLADLWADRLPTRP